MRLQRNGEISQNNKEKRAKRESRRQRVRILCYIALIGLCCFCLWRMEVRRDRSQEKPKWPHQVIQIDEEQEDNTGQGSRADVIKLDSIHSTYAIVLDGETGEILAEKNSEEKMYPASMTKLMAALVAVERTEDWNASIEIPQNIFAKLYAEHASLAGFEPGERVTPEDLLYGMLLPSGAECCTVYAMWLAGDEETFVEWMNEKAAELGMENTHFVNTTGLHDTQHYSTAEDIAVLMRQCLQNETLRSALQADVFQTTPTTLHPQGLTLESTLFQAVADNSGFTEKLAEAKDAGAVLLGGKTGYTSQAGLCLASFANIDGREYILVTAGAEGNHYTDPFHIEDAFAVYQQIAE